MIIFLNLHQKLTFDRMSTPQYRNINVMTSTQNIKRFALGRKTDVMTLILWDLENVMRFIFSGTGPRDCWGKIANYQASQFSSGIFNFRFCKVALWAYHQASSIGCKKSPNLNISHLVSQLSLPNPLKPGVKSRMKMQLEQRRQAMLQLHLNDQQFYCLLWCVLY